MIENRYLDLKSVTIHRVIPSSVKRNGKPVSLQVTFLVDGQVGHTGRVIIHHSQTFHARLESDGKYHYRNTRQARGTDGQMHTVFIDNAWDLSDFKTVNLSLLAQAA